MKTNEKLYPVVLAFATVVLFLIFISSTASAAPSPAVVETRITNHGTALNPDINGNIIVWQDNRNKIWHIYMYDVSAHKETQLTTNSVNPILASQINPDIYRNIVVWEDHLNKNSDIYMEDLLTKKQTRVTTSGKAYKPGIYGNTIVWQDNRSGKWAIYTYNLTTKKETKINSGGPASNPDINGNRIVWEDYRNGSPVIGMYDLSAHKETLLNFEFIYEPVIYGSRIVYVTDADNLAMYDFSTSTGIQVSPSDISTNPAIYSDRVAYEYITWDNSIPKTYYDIYMFNISTTKRIQVTTNGSSKYPAIYGDKIVYEDFRDYGDESKNDIYMATLIYPPVAVFSASPLSGKKPLTVKFTDKSTNNPTSWYWNFGDKSTSKDKNPTHKYTKAGKYTVRLTVKNKAGNNTKTMLNYITVK